MDSPSSFKGHLYKQKIYYSEPKISPDDFVIWPKPMGRVTVEIPIEMEGVFECSLVAKDRIELQFEFYKIK